MRNKNIKKLTYSAILAALAIVLNLTNFLPMPRLYLGYIPLMVSGILLGPFFGAVTGIVTDLVGFITTGGIFLPIFTLTSALAGLIPGIISYYFIKERNIKLWQIAVAVVLVQVAVVPLNMFGVIQYFNQNFSIIFLPRFIIALIMIPVFTVIVTAIVKLYFKAFPGSLK